MDWAMIVSLRTVWYGTMGIFFFTPLVIRSVWKARILQIQIRIRTNSVLPTLYQMGSDHIPSSKFARGKNTFIYKGWEHCNHYICWYFILTITSILTGIIGSLPWAKHKELWFPYMNVSSTVFPISESDQSIIAIRWAIWKCEKMSVLSWIHPKQNSPNMHHNAGTSPPDAIASGGVFFKRRTTLSYSIFDQELSEKSWKTRLEVCLCYWFKRGEVASCTSPFQMGWT